MNRFPLHRPPPSRPRLLAGDRRCCRCGLPACIQFGVAGPCYCTGCTVKVVRRHREACHDQRQHPGQLTSRQSLLPS